jgi:hypothetical protein
MANLLFKLNNVPDDEADEIRNLLDDAKVDYYETSAGNWGLSFAAIWLKDAEQLDHAKQLIDQYQNERYQRVRSERMALAASGEQITWWQSVKAQPIKLVAVFIFIAVVLYLTVVPFFSQF